MIPFRRNNLQTVFIYLSMLEEIGMAHNKKMKLQKRSRQSARIHRGFEMPVGMGSEVSILGFRTSKELREKYLVVQSVIIQAFGKLGNFFYKNRKADMANILFGLKRINWFRNADCWYLRVVKENGRMMNNERAISLATNMLKISLGINLSENERNIENEFDEYRGRI